MNASNMAKVFGPSLFARMQIGTANAILKTWITHFQTIFVDYQES